MENLAHKKPGRPTLYDFSKMQVGERMDLTGRGGIESAPYAYVAKWNRFNDSAQVKVIKLETGQKVIERVK